MSQAQPLHQHHGEVPHQEAPAATPLERFLDENFRKIIVAAVFVLVAVMVGGYWKYRTSTIAREAGEMVAAAKSPEDCDIIAQKFPGSLAAGNALLIKADLLWQQNKKDSALGALREFTSKFSKHPMFLSGLVGLASKLESMDNKAEAKSIYERIVSEFGRSEFAPLAEIRLGDMLMAEGKEDEARKIFDTLPSKYPGTPFFEQSEMRKDWIAAALPTKEVDPPPQPKKEEKPADPKAAAPAISPTIPSTGGPLKLEGKPSPPALIVPPGGTAVTTPPVPIPPAPAKTESSKPAEPKPAAPAPSPAPPPTPQTPPKS